MFDLIQGRGRIVFASRDGVIYLFNLFRFVGLNPPQRFRFLYFLYGSAGAIFIVLLTPFMYNVGWIRDRNSLSTMEILSRLQSSINTIGLPIKSVALALSVGRLRSVEPLLKGLDSRYTAPEDLAKIRNCAITCNRIVFGYFVSYMLFELATLVSALFGGHVPISLWIPNLDWRRSTKEYWLQFGSDAILVFFSLSHQILNDCYSPTYIYIIRTQVQLLANRVKRLGTAANTSEDEVYDELRECIITHQEILRLVRIVEPVISVTLFVQFLLAAAVMGTTAINIFIFADVSTRIFSTIYLFCVVLQISPTCYHATHLQSDCEQLSMYIFHCNWMTQDKRFNKVLIYFLQRTQAEMPLFALKLMPISLATSVSIAKFSFSVYTFIQKMAVDRKG